jgi:hypothetical protein
MENIYSSPTEYIDDYLKKFIRNYKLQQKMIAEQPSSIIKQISYEYLFNQKIDAFKDLLEFLSLPVNINDINTAIEFSSINAVKKQEQERGVAIHHNTPDFKGSFVRDGSTQQYQTVFSKEDLDRVKIKLQAEEIPPSEFF